MNSFDANDNKMNTKSHTLIQIDKDTDSHRLRQTHTDWHRHTMTHIVLLELLCFTQDLVALGAVAGNCKKKPKGEYQRTAALGLPAPAHVLKTWTR